MVATGLIESWSGNPQEVGPLYPFVGWEVLMYAVCVVLCIGFFVWKLVTETAGYEKRAAELRSNGRLEEALSGKPGRNI